MYRDNVDDPYRSRKDHKFNSADAYHYDHMSNNSQQRQQPPQQQPPHQHHPTIHHSRKSSMSSTLPQKYYAMVRNSPEFAFSLPFPSPPPSPKWACSTTAAKNSHFFFTIRSKVRMSREMQPTLILVTPSSWILHAEHP